MAEPTTPPPAPAPGPALASTADAVAYVSVSWMAVAALAVTSLYVLILLVAGLVAYGERRPLLIDWALFLPVVAVVLSFAARRVVTNAEGTRTAVLFGADLPAVAWWGAVVLGLGYLAYLIAVNYAIRRDAEGEFQRWVGYVQKDDVTRAFHRTRDPLERATTRPDDAVSLENRWRNDFVAFRQTDLVRLAARNPGQTEFVVAGLRDWSYKPTGVECVVAGTLTCPEGTFPLSIPMKGLEAGSKGDGGGRQWQITLPQSGGGFVQREQVKLTPYGWYLIELEGQGSAFARAFVRDCGEPNRRVFAAVAYAQAGDAPALRTLTTEGAAARLAAVGVPGGLAWSPGPAEFRATAEHLFRLPGGAAPSPEQFKQFLFAWETSGIVPVGGRLKDNPDTNGQLSFPDGRVELRVPIEIPLAGAKRDIVAARGRVVLEATNPAVAAEAKRLREAAGPAQGTATPPDAAPTAPITWKVVRIESDMKPVSARPQGAPPGGPEE